jgi:hypothetical protein
VVDGIPKYNRSENHNSITPERAWLRHSAPQGFTLPLAFIGWDLVDGRQGLAKWCACGNCHTWDQRYWGVRLDTFGIFWCQSLYLSNYLNPTSTLYTSMVVNVQHPGIEFEALLVFADPSNKGSIETDPSPSDMTLVLRL